MRKDFRKTVYGKSRLLTSRLALSMIISMYLTGCMFAGDEDSYVPKGGAGGIENQAESLQAEKEGAGDQPGSVPAGQDGTEGIQTEKGDAFQWNRYQSIPSDLPEAYDYRKEGRAPRIGNQGSLGTCWAFASLTALESTLLPSNPLTFSADHMSMHNSFLLGQDEGGEYTMSMAYLLSWQGPVLESEDPYGDGISPDGLLPKVHVQEIQILPSKDYEAIKAAVYETGGVQSSLYTSMQDYESESVYYNKNTNSYCYMGGEEPNHDSVIVGWDDSYPRENFNMDLPGDGAFICTNSWGEDFGDQGYFYVSYFDTNIGVHNIVYTGIESADNYSRVYQSDLCGWVGQIGYGKDTAWFANVYQAGTEEALAAAGFYATGEDTSYELYLVRDFSEEALEQETEKETDRKTDREISRETGRETGRETDRETGKGRKKWDFLAKGRLEHAGYYTIPLEKKIPLEAKEKFAIIVKITTPDTVHPVAIEYDAGDGIAQVELGDGEGYLSHDGAIWERVEKTHACNLCLKAYMVSHQPE